MDLRELDAIGMSPLQHWYYRTKRIPVGRYFTTSARGRPLDVVDIGAGSGVFSDDLADRFGDQIRNIVRVDLNYPTEGSAPDPRIGGVIQHQRLLPASIEQSLLLLMDVLEHVPDDGAFLRSVVEVCHGTNHVFITVPAFQSLWSGHDEFLGHYRRYSLDSLTALAEASGVRVTSAYYLFGFIFPGVWMIRRLVRRAEVRSDMRRLPTWLNALLSAVGRLDAAVCRSNRLCGVTAVVEGEISR